MPLYKNEEKINLNPKEIEAIERHFHGKFPVRVVYPPERIQRSRLKHNILPDKPNSISFNLRATVKTPSGTDVWRYADSVIVDDKGRKRYFPNSFLFDGTRWLERNDIELIYFLLRKSEYCVGGDNFQGTAKFVFEDLVTEAEKKAEKKQIQAKVNKFLYDEEYQLTEDKLRAVAKAYQITGVDELKPAQVKILLENKIFSSKDGPQEFFLMINDDEQIKARNSITKAMEMKILVFNDKKQSWVWVSADGTQTNICKVPPTKTPNEAIYDFYLGSNSFKEDLQAVLLTKNPKAGKKKEPATVEEGDEKEE